jgi:mono/diheme cytochrome c family protein
MDKSIESLISRRILVASMALVFFTGLMLTTYGFAQQPADPAEFFEAHIRPVFATNCLGCHGDAQTAGLRLDSRDNLLKGGKSGPAIVPGNPDSSLLIQAVQQTHERLKMPPGKKLNETEIRDLRAWVSAGAPWPEAKGTISKERAITPEQRAFWSFQPIHRAIPPDVRDPAWVQSPIDRFILARLETSGLTPVAAADKRVLIRRATFDLIGLPPKPEEVHAFLHDSSPEAFTHVVDRLLASPHFGERWGRYWLDVARYAEDDTRGIGQESYQNAWRYRDWVVKAFNDDMPYDLFAKAQIAGDLLEDKHSNRLRPGLGFFGLGPWYYDMAEPPQARADERHDRVDALTRGFLGLTVACARCHDHKYDPISSKDYYALAGVFASSDYVDYPLVSSGIVEAYQGQKEKISEQDEAIKQYTQKLAAILAEIEAQKTALYLARAWRVIGPEKLAPDSAVASQLDRETLERWVRYLSDPEKDHPYLKPWYEATRHGASSAELRKIATDFQNLSLAILREKEAIDEENLITMGQHKTVIDALANHLPNGFATYEDFCPGCSVVVKAIERDKFVLWNDLFGKEPPPAQPDAAPTSQGAIYLYSGDAIDRWLSGEWKTHLDEMRAQLKTLKSALPQQYPFLHGIGEAAHPVNLKVNLRGSPYNLGDEAPRRFLTVLSNGEPAPFTKGSGRLELAEAIVQHPLAARVMANRIWERLFGAGIVRTPSNFGKMGQRPTHPELLDYLASKMIENRWSVKSLIREIMLSTVYQLSSDYSARDYAQDPGNQLLWRMNRRRLDAEALRDSILFVAGSLDEAIGGPSVDLATDRKRRTVYGKVSRFELNETLALFDFPSPSITAEKRNITLVPLQRLYFLNSDLVMGESRVLAASMGGHDAAAAIRELYERLVARPASNEEIGIALEFLRKHGGAWSPYVQALLASNEFSFLD